ncbi:hypothetical protein M666_13210 [Cellulophaga baltica 18]|uniref:Uncharacterized protein n=1 Tax=Cellulophaga baltica 18 TaxID=1348584 RepID=A0AAU8RUK3_9FLAO|nr:hypothetical protein M666_13210 [Cellulophaga baltica 18]
MIYVFKTSVKFKKEVKELKPFINDILPNSKWNFDLEDCDNIFRVDSAENIVNLTKMLFNNHDFKCEELE